MYYDIFFDKIFIAHVNGNEKENKKDVELLKQQNINGIEIFESDDDYNGIRCSIKTSVYTSIINEFVSEQGNDFKSEIRSAFNKVQQGE